MAKRGILNLPSDDVIGQLRRMERDRRLPPGTLVASDVLRGHIINVPGYWGLKSEDLRRYNSQLEQIYGESHDDAYATATARVKGELIKYAV